jgi:hypothetical protein
MAATLQVSSKRAQLCFGIRPSYPLVREAAFFERRYSGQPELTEKDCDLQNSAFVLTAQLLLVNRKLKPCGHSNQFR